MRADKILLFIPMYNCEKQIVRVLDQLNGEIVQYISEVILVNNRSTDNGETAVQNYFNRYTGSLPMKLLRNHQNYGLGGSHKVAFDYAIKNQFNYVIVFHGDDQGNIADLLPVLRAGTHKNYDCCLGSRFLPDSKFVNYSKFRIFGNRVFNIIFSISAGFHIRDLGAGINLYSVPMLKSRYYEQFADDLTFNNYMILAVSAYHQKYMFFPHTWRSEDQVSNVKAVKQTLQVLKIACGYFFLRKKFLLRDMRDSRISEYAADVICERK